MENWKIGNTRYQYDTHGVHVTSNVNYQKGVYYAGTKLCNALPVNIKMLNFEAFLFCILHHNVIMFTYVIAIWHLQLLYFASNLFRSSLRTVVTWWSPWIKVKISKSMIIRGNAATSAAIHKPG